MQKLINKTSRKFAAIIFLSILFVVAITWSSLQYYNQTEIASPASISEIHTPANENEAFGKYLEEQKEFEAHFITLASSIKQQEADRVTRALTFTAIASVLTGVLISLIVTRKLMKPVREAYQSQERFLQDAAHELRNPLAAMTVTLQQTPKNKIDDPAIKTFRRQTNRLVNITEDLLFLEKKTEKSIEEINVSELLNDVIEELQPIAKSRKIEIVSKIEDGLILEIAPTDYIRMVKNIIDNAIKYSKNNGKVVISQKKIKKNIEIKVRDAGVGIPAKDIEQVGSRFFRASNTGKVNGTGLGLAIVNKILNLYGGEMSITSKANKGTNVTLTLPS